MSIRLGLIRGLREKQEEEKKQHKLRKKYDVSDKPNVIIVEKSNIGKFLCRLAGNIIQYFFRIILVCLAFIGLASIIYPVPRNALIDTGLNALHEIAELING